MQDKCPKCGEPLITKMIKKELVHGSIDYPVALVCPKCHWSKDLTGAGDIVSQPVAPGKIKTEEKPSAAVPVPPPKAVPPKPQPKLQPSLGFNKIITIALAILVIGGIVWAFFLFPTTPEQAGTPKPTATITKTPVQTPTGTPVPEVTPTGNKTLVKLDSRRGFIPDTKTIKPGDEVVWRNTGIDTVTLVSSDGLFDARLLANDKEFRYTFLKLSGTYNFYLRGNTNLKGTITVEP
jgi:plastocyanin